MHSAQSRKHFPQLLLFEFHAKYYNLNLRPITILKFECLELNMNYPQKSGLINQTIDQNLIVHKIEKGNFKQKNSCDHSKTINELSNLTFIFQPKSWIPTVDDEISVNSLHPSRDASLIMQLPLDSILSASLKKNYKILYQLFGSVYAEALKNKEKFFNTLLINRTDNKYSLNMIENKMSSVIQELHQIRETNEQTLSVLKQEMITLKDFNKTFTKEMENMSNILENISTNFKSMASKPLKSIPDTEFLTPPPPPPPMPPSPVYLSLFTTPKSTKKGKNSRSPTKKLSITGEKRPIITVEDLLKVTLKKAPPKNEKENERKDEAKRFGPVVTTDMLKKVKLKSIKCKGTAENIRVPFRTLKSNENRNQS